MPENQLGRFKFAHIAWWVFVPGGILLLYFQATNPSLHQWYGHNIHPLPSQNILLWILVACLPIHTFEAALTWRLSRKIGRPDQALLWAFQTFFLGYFSTKLLWSDYKLVQQGGRENQAKETPMQNENIEARLN